MREILFRGKRKDTQEWVSGNYVYNYRHNSHMIFYNCTGCENSGFRSRRADFELQDCEVIPETICQYTGLTDKNGRKIFEGDILSFSAYGDNYKGDVRFIKGNFTIWCGKCATFLDDALEKHSAIVIGNIFDNLELIRK